MSTSGYDYSPFHRKLEIASIIALGGAVALLFWEAYKGLIAFPGNTWWLIPASLVVAYLVADFVSGFIHFVGDTFGTPEMPIFGPNFIKPFREHHVDPRGITRHDFIETNGNNSLVCVPAAFLVYLVIPVTYGLWATFFVMFTAWFMIWIFMTNQFHKWSHLEEIPGWIHWMQRWRIILEPGHHDIHHTPPFDTYYCITTGWLNPILHKLRFFPVAEVVLRFIFRAPKPPTSSNPAPPQVTQQS